MKILIAEDNAHIRNGLMEVLAHEGYRPIAAENGVQALALYRQQQPDFIILDIMMPELDGYKVCREIRKHDWQTPIIFLSAKDEEIDRVIGLELVLTTTSVSPSVSMKCAPESRLLSAVVYEKYLNPPKTQASRLAI